MAILNSQGKDIPQKSTLTPKEQRLMRHWFRKTDSNTIELKEKRWAPAKVFIGLLLLAGIYYDFFHPEYKEFTARELKYTFQPTVVFEETWRFYRDYDNPNITKTGQSKEDFMKESWEEYKTDSWWGYFVVGKYILFLIYYLWSSKRRVRFDRKRGIIYTYLDKKFYLTEVNKLMRPFPEYISFVGGLVGFWVHPYQQPKRFGNFRQGSQMIVLDYTMWIPMMFALIPGVYEKSKGAVLKRFLVDFMNPDTPPERIASMMQALESKRTLREWLAKIIFGWLDGGLYCRKLPKDEFLEQEIEKYFVDDAPNIKALPSCRLRTYEESKRMGMKFTFMELISVEENILHGYKKVPCPNLYEYPKVSLHYNSLGTAWGNERDDELSPHVIQWRIKEQKAPNRPKK